MHAREEARAVPGHVCVLLLDTFRQSVDVGDKVLQQEILLFAEHFHRVLFAVVDQQMINELQLK